jgi:hypothetical protein
MSSRLCGVLVVSILVLCASCPSTSFLRLAGDSRLVGTWESDYEFMGYHIYQQSTYDTNGDFRKTLIVREDNSVATVRGKWYADSLNGLYDVTVTWTNPNTPDAHGIAKGYYEVIGNTVHSWSNPVGMARPSSRETAAAYGVATRIQNKEAVINFNVIEQPGIVDWLLKSIL